MEKRFPLPPFTEDTARQKIQMAEDAWNSKDPERVSKAYSPDSEWRNRDRFINGREEIVAFLTEKWNNEINYKLKKDYWAHTGNPGQHAFNLRLKIEGSRYSIRQ